MPKLSKKDAYHRYWVTEAMLRLEYDIANEIDKRGRLPSGWHDLATSKEGPKKKVTFRVEEDVLKFFKSLGPGYHSRMNDVLKTFMHAKLARLLEGRDTPKAVELRSTPRRLEWGDLDKHFEELEEMSKTLNAKA